MTDHKQINEKDHASLALIDMYRAQRDALLAALKAARRAIGDHIAPEHCYATGPLTGGSIRDLVQCPACSAISMYEAVIASIESATPPASPQPSDTESDGIIYEIDFKFKSGNDVPVESVRVTRDQWLALLSRLDAQPVAAAVEAERERIAAQWDGCMYYFVGEGMIDIGQAIRSTAQKSEGGT